MKFLKRYFFILIIGIAEILFFINTKPKHYEELFLTFGLISIVIFLYRIYNQISDGHMFGMVAEESRRPYVDFKAEEARKSFQLIKKLTPSAILTLSYLLLIVFNIIGYIIVTL